MAYGRYGRKYTTKRRGTPYRRTPYVKKKATKAVARKKPRAARFALAKRIDSLAVAVKKNTRRALGDMQLSQQVFVPSDPDTFNIGRHYPVLFCMDEFQTALDSQTPSAANCTTAYQLTPAGVLQAIGLFRNFNWNNTSMPVNYDGWGGCRTDQCGDSGKYYASSATYEWTFRSQAQGDDTRIKLTYFKVKKEYTKLLPVIDLVSILTQGKNLLNGNHLSPVYFKILGEKNFYLNNASDVGMTGTRTLGSGPRTRKHKCYHKFNKMVRQSKTLPGPGDASPPAGYKLETGQRSFFDPIFCMVSCNEDVTANPNKVTFDLNRVCRWRDTIGSAFL